MPVHDLDSAGSDRSRSGERPAPDDLGLERSVNDVARGGSILVEASAGIRSTKHPSCSTASPESTRTGSTDTAKYVVEISRERWANQPRTDRFDLGR